MTRQILHGLLKHPKEGERAIIALLLILLVDGSVEEDCKPDVDLHLDQYSAYNNVSKGQHLTISCFTNILCVPKWNILINDKALLYSTCSGGWNDPIIGDLKCATSKSTNNNTTKITISMSVNHSTVLQCYTTAVDPRRSELYAFLVHSDDICTESLVASSSPSPNVSSLPVTLSSFLPSLSTLSPSTLTMKVQSTSDNNSLSVNPSSLLGSANPSSSFGNVNPSSSLRNINPSSSLGSVNLSSSLAKGITSTFLGEMTARVTTEPSHSGTVTGSTQYVAGASSAPVSWLTALTGTGLVVLLAVILPLIVVLLILIFRSCTQQFKKQTPMTTDKAQETSEQSFTVENIGARQEETEDI